MASNQRTGQPGLEGVRAAIYARVSTTKQEEEGTSLESQVERCRAYAVDRGYEVVDEYKEVFSGAVWRERPLLTGLLRRVCSDEYDVVISYALDRLSRDQVHIAVIVDQLDIHGVQLEFVTEQFEASTVGTFIRAAKAFASQVEREKITERTQRGILKRAESGKLLASKNPLYGYRWRDESRGSLEIDEGNAKIVRRIFDEIGNGTSMVQLAKQMNADGIPTPRRGSYGWSATTIGGIVRNEAYKGEAFSFKWRTMKASTGGVRQVQRPKEEWVPLPPGTIPALVSGKEWDDANIQREHNRRGAVRNNRNPQAFLLRAGFVRCGYCNHALVGRSRPDLNPHYVCGKTGCRHHSIRADILDMAVWDKVGSVLGDPDFIRQYMTQGNALDASEQRKKDLEASLKKAKRQQDSLVEVLSLLTNSNAQAATAEKLDEIGSQIQVLESQLTEIVREIALLRRTAEQASTVFEWFEVGNEHLESMSYDEKRSWLTRLRVEVRLWGKDCDPRYEIEMGIDPSFWEPVADDEVDGPIPSGKWITGRNFSDSDAEQPIVESTARRSWSGNGSPRSRSTTRG